MLVGSAEVRVSPEASGFGPKTEAAIKKALAGVKADVEITLDGTALRAKVNAAVKAATSGIQAKIGTDIDTSPITTKVKKAVSDAAATIASTPGGQLDLFDIDPAKLTAEVAAAKEAARLALAAGRQLNLELDFDGPELVAKAAATATAARAAMAAALAVGDGPGGQTNLFNVDPAEVVAKVVAVKEAARVALASTEQLELDLDFDGPALVAKVAAMARAAEARGDITLKVKVEGAEEALQKAMAAAGMGDRDIGVERQLDPAVRRLAAERALQGALAGLDDLDVEVDMSLDDDGFRAKVSAVVAAAEVGQEVEVPVDIGGRGGGAGDADRVGAAAGGIFGRAVLRSAARVLAAGGLAQIFTAATSGAVALGGALIAATGSAGSLVSVASVLPGILSAAAQAAASIGFALGGVGGALKAYTSMQNAIGKAAAGGAGGGGDSGASARAAERAIRNAQRGVEDAYRSAADAVENANERIENAGRSLIRAQRSQQEAQEDLTQARIEAREEAEELRRSVERLSLTEAEARRRLAEARIRNALAQQRAEMDLTGVTEETLKALERQAALEDKAAVNPREKAANDLRDAELDLEEATAKRVETQEKLAEFDRTGVEGTERVIEAKERLVDANEEVVDRERDLIKANRDLVRAQEDGARRIAEAQENLADAIARAAEGAAGAAGGAAGAIDAYEAALARLSPAARRFVEFLVSLEPILKRVQATAAQGLFPGLEVAITTLLPLVGDLEPIIGATAKALADLAIEGANLIASPGFRGDLVLQGQRNIDIITGLGRAAISGGNSLRYITIAAGPLTQHLVNLTQHFALLAEEALAVGRANGSLDAFFGRVQNRVDRLIVTTQAFGTGLFRVFREATPAGDKYLDTLTSLAVRFDILTKRASESGALREFFESTRPAVEAIGRLVGDVVVGLGRLGTANFGAFTGFIEQLRGELLPVLLKVLGTIDTDFLSALVSLTTAMTNLFGSVLAGNPTLTLFVNTLAQMADGISSLLTDIPVLSPILQGVVTAFGALAVIGAVAALKDFASTVFGAKKALMDLTGTVAVVKKGTDEIAFSATRTGRAYEFLGNVISKAFVIGAIVLAAKSAIDSFAPSLDKLASSFASASDPAAEFEKQLQRINKPGLFDSFAQAAKLLVNDPLKAIGLAMDTLTGNFDRVAATVKTLGVTTEEAFRKAAEGSIGQAKKAVDSWEQQGVSTLKYKRILSDVIQEKALQNIAEEEVQRTLDEMTTSLKANNDELQKHADQMRKAAEQALALSGANIAMEAAYDDLTAAIAKDTTAMDINEASGRAAKSGLDRYITSISDSIVKFGQSTAAGHMDAESKQRILNNLDRLANIGYPGAREAAERLRGELEAIKPEYFATVNVNTAEAQEAMRQLRYQFGLTEQAARNAVAAFGAANAAKFTADVNSDFGDITKNFREFGGRVLRNTAYIVGEKRPELFIPDRDGVILPQVPPMSMPTGIDPGATDSPLNLSGTTFNMDGLLSALRDLEETLTEQLSSDGNVVRSEDIAGGAGGQATSSVTVEQTITGPFVSMENTFGPGAAVEDLLKAMDSVADRRIIELMLQVLKDHGAGAGTRL